MAPKLLRTAAVAASALLTLSTLSACGFDQQTNLPYTPAQGVNADQGGVGVRNLVIVADNAGKGYLSGAFVAQQEDTLTAVTGTAQAADGAEAGAITFGSSSVTITPGELTNLIDEAPITASGSGLKPGLTAHVTLTFSQAGDVTLVTPVVDASSPDYEGVTPKPASSASTTP